MRTNFFERNRRSVVDGNTTRELKGGDSCRGKIHDLGRKVPYRTGGDKARVSRLNHPILLLLAPPAECSTL